MSDCTGPSTSQSKDEFVTDTDMQNFSLETHSSPAETMNKESADHFVNKLGPTIASTQETEVCKSPDLDSSKRSQVNTDDESALECIGSLFDEPNSTKPNLHDKSWNCSDPNCKTINIEGDTFCKTCQLSKGFTDCIRNRKKKLSRKNKADMSDYGVRNMDEFSFVNYHGFKVYLQSAKNYIDFQRFQEKLNNFCKNADLVPIAETNQMTRKWYIARVDGTYYRAAIERISKNLLDGKEKLYEVVLVDVGKITTVESNCIFPLDPIFKVISSYAKKFYLHHVRLDQQKSDEILEWFRQRLSGKALTVKTFKVPGKWSRNWSTDHVEIYEGTSLINRELCLAGLATPTISLEKNPNPAYAANEIQRYETTHRELPLLFPPQQNMNDRSKEFLYSDCFQRIPMGGQGGPPRQFNSSSYSCIPPSNFQNLPTFTDYKDREIYSLQGELQVYKETLDSEKLNGFSTKLNLTCKKMHNLVKWRSLLEPFIADESALIRALKALFTELTFHSYFDNVIQEGYDLQKMISVRKEVSTDKLRGFEGLVLPLNLKQKAFIIQSLTEQLRASLNDLCLIEELYREADEEEVNYTPFTRIGRDFIVWINDYVVCQVINNEAVKELSEDLDQYRNFFSSVVAMTECQLPAKQLSDKQDLWKSLEAENNLVEKLSNVSLACRSVLKELDLRLEKIKTVDMLHKEIKKIDPKLVFETIGCDVAEQTQEETYPTLLSFISQSRTMTPQTKCLIIRDIVKELTVLHSQKESYLFLTPNNVLMAEGAVLCSSDKASIYEPILPFRFFAPECDVSSSVTGPRVGSLPVGPASDCYSLGKLIVWLACVESKEDFLQEMVQTQKKNALLEALLSTEPKSRPSLKSVQEGFTEMMVDVFGVCESDIREEEDVVVDQNGEGGLQDSQFEGVFSSLRGDAAQAVSFENLSVEDVEDRQPNIDDLIQEKILEEEKLIMKEMQDTDDESVEGAVEDRDVKEIFGNGDVVASVISQTDVVNVDEKVE